jgi:tetratricopeptide (TPR) repeat protein
MIRQAATNLGILALSAFLLWGCEKGGADPSGPAVLHPLAAPMAGVRDQVKGLNEEELASIDAFLTRSDPSLAFFQVRRVCGILGKGLENADPVAVGDFVLEAAPHLYDDFFRAFSDEKLEKIAAALPGRSDGGEVELLMIEAVIRLGRGAFNGTLKQALKDVPFEEAVAPRKLPLRAVMPPEDGNLEAYTAAAEIMRLDTFLEEGARPELAIRTYREALRRWPGDAALVAGLASLYLENASKFGDELDEFLVKAPELDPRNALYGYLRAARLFRVGRDDEAFEVLGAALEGEQLRFHSLTRAERTSKFLRKRGYGPIRSRLAGHRAASLASYFELKDLANRALQRSHEYENAGDEERVEMLVGLPIALDRQLEGGSHMLMVQVIRFTILSAGLRRVSELAETKAPKTSLKLLERATKAEQRLRTIEQGRERCGGNESLGLLYRSLGEKGFLTYLDSVLYGNEAAFLEECSTCTSIDEVLPLTQKPYRFD